MLKTIMAATAVSMVLGGAVLAQERQSTQTQRQETQRQADDRDTDDRPTNQLTLADADTIEGSKVSNAQGERIGSIEDVVVDVRKGQVAYAIVGVGGFLGAGEKNVAVPWDRLRPGQEAQSFVLNVDRQTLQNAPSVERDKVANLEDQSARRNIASFWDKVGSAAQQAETPREDRTQNR